MSVPVVDVGALVKELGIEPEYVTDDFESTALSADALAAIEALHHVCKGGSGGLVAINHGFEDKVEGALQASKAFHEQDKPFKDTYSAQGIYDGYVLIYIYIYIYIQTFIIIFYLIQHIYICLSI